MAKFKAVSSAETDETIESLYLSYIMSEKKDPDIIIMHPTRLKAWIKELSGRMHFDHLKIKTYLGIEVITSEDMGENEIRVY